ncbi:hypothetical protein ACVXHA_15135 [Escherichia coli]
MGDGCLMEGIPTKVCSLAGTRWTGKLIGFYDHNGISIDGEQKAGLPTIRQNVLKPITACDP